MKKDIEWLRKRLNQTIKFEALNDREIGFKLAMEEVIDLLNQLDEPEVLSQEWIDGKTFVVTDSDGDDYAVVTHSSLQNLIAPKKEITEEQVMNWLDNNEFYDHITAETVLERAVDKGELNYYGTKYSVIEAPVIPKYVAEFLELVRSNDSLMLILEVASTRGERSKWKKEYDWISSNSETFARAWLYGYTVEDAQKYYVMNDENELILGWSQSAYMTPCIEGYEYMKYNGRENLFQLTEQEIKDYDERYWAFAKPVEELEQ